MPPRIPTAQEAAIRCDEKRRLGRELHDSTSQLLVVLQLNLASLKRCSQPAEVQRLFCALEEIIQELHREVRAVSAEACPLREDLPAALGAMAKRFSVIANVMVSMDVQGDYVAQADEVEMSLYRIAQEALANIARHAEATEVSLQLDYRKATLKLAIEDNGVGFQSRRGAPLPEIGNGVENMKQRVHEMGGRLRIRQLDPGSRITVTIGQSPLHAAGRLIISWLLKVAFDPWRTWAYRAHSTRFRRSAAWLSESRR